jgi:hypothetical protein
MGNNLKTLRFLASSLLFLLDRIDSSQDVSLLNGEQGEMEYVGVPFGMPGSFSSFLLFELGVLNNAEMDSINAPLGSGCW